MQAQQFQEMFLKVILDRSEFNSEFVPLGKDDYCESSSSTFYLLLPVIFHKNSVDWKIIRRCLSSPVFGTPGGSVDRKSLPSHGPLQLHNGRSSESDVENSLVYATHKKWFYFVTNIVFEKNGYSPYKDSDSLSHVDHLISR